MQLLKYGLGIVVLGGLIFWYYKKPITIDHDVLLVGTNVEYQPFSFLDTHDEIVGLDIDIAKEVCKRLGKKCVFHTMSFDALIPEIQLGTIHVIAAGMSPTAERAERVFFTKPHLYENPLLVVTRTANNREKLIDNLASYRIAVNQGYVPDSYVTQQQYPHVVRLAGNSVSEGLLALKSNQADVYIVAKNAVKPFFDQDTTQEFSATPLSGTEEKIALAVSKKYPELYEQVEKIIIEMQEDGTIAQLIKKWNIS
jgi:ABC-type amino acid transport substrate-binding protein